MKKITLTVSLCFLTLLGFSQPICGFDGLHKKLLADPAIAEKMQISEIQLQKYIAAHPIDPSLQGFGTALYIIPVVVHIVHTGGSVGSLYNPEDAQIQATIDYLNQVYDGTAAGFSGGVGDIQIQFKLAQRDPNCNPTNGIVRVNGSSLPGGYNNFGVKATTSTGTSELDLKNLSRWDPANYYNIWTVNKIDGKDGTSGSYIAGFARFAGTSASLDGTVMLATQTIPGSKVMAHELGHAFNLYHPFEGSSNKTQCPVNTNCNSNGDRVCDTDPISYNATAAGVVDFSCRTGTNPCTGTPYSINTERNVMNYTNCFTLFTAGQKARMLAAMTLPSRVSLANSVGDEPTYGPISPCVPKINFSVGAVAIKETSTLVDGCRGYTDYSFSMTIGNSPSVAASAIITASGTATNGFDYLLTTNGSFTTPSNTLNFPAGVRNNKDFTVRIYDDAEVEPTETIELNFTVNNGGGNAAKGDAISTLVITVESNDTAPAAIINQQAIVGTNSFNLGDANSSHPLDARLARKKTLMLYKASELTAMGLTAGNIDSFGIYIEKHSTRPYNNLQISMGATNLQYLVDGVGNAVAVSAVKTFASYNTVNGLNLFGLNAPFAWNGISNIAVELCYDNGTADVNQGLDFAQGYSDGGTNLQANMYWQNDIACATGYNSVSLYYTGIKPVAFFSISKPGSLIATALNASGTAYLGPNSDVYFYNGTGEVLARIKNMTAFDYGCTLVKIDRAGTNTFAYTNNLSSDAVAAKTYQVLPANNNPNGQYEITLYYTAAEVQGWKSSTGKNWASAKILKTPNPVGTYIPGSVPAGQVTASVAGTGGYSSDSTITAVFSNGFSGFAVGNPNLVANTIYTFTGNGLWTNAANWASNLVPPASLPAGSQIIIDPMVGGQCTLNTAQTIQPGGTIKVNANKIFIIQGNLDLVN